MPAALAVGQPPNDPGSANGGMPDGDGAPVGRSPPGDDRHGWKSGESGDGVWNSWYWPSGDGNGYDDVYCVPRGAAGEMANVCTVSSGNAPPHAPPPPPPLPMLGDTPVPDTTVAAAVAEAVLLAAAAVVEAEAARDASMRLEAQLISRATA